MTQNKISIVLAEDHKIVRQGLKTLLELEEDFSIVGEAENGIEAVRLAGQTRPEIIVMDLQMPMLDGIGAIKHIRRIKELSDVPIIAVSGDGRRGIELFACIEELGSGHIDYLAKPFSFDALLEKIDSLLTVQV